MQPPEPHPLPSNTTRLLTLASRGNREAQEQFYSLMYEELRTLGHRCLQREAPGHTLQTTALVHEAYLRLLPKTNLEWEGRAHFFAVAAGTMRAILVDHARRRRSAKRGGRGQRVALDGVVASYEAQAVNVLAVDEALERLQQVDPELARLVELRFFAGLTIPEVAEIQRVSTNTVDRRWRTARAWMKTNLEGASS